MKHVVKTDIGVVRTENQDRAAVFKGKNSFFAILCDGMGGHNGGSTAASITISIFEKEYNKNEPTRENVVDWFSETIKKTVLEMKKMSEDNEILLDMGTTLTAAIVFEKTIIITNIGDSRTYIYNGLLHQITTDHNLRNYYILNYGYSEDEASQIIGAAALTSALGPKKNITPESFEVELTSKTKFLVLTSDGIHDYISKPAFEAILSKEDDLNSKSELLIAQAIKGKSSDNLTCVIVDLKET